MSNGSIQNIDKLMKKLQKLNIDSKQELKQSMERNIKMVQGEAKLLCPVDTGSLRNSIVTNVKETSKGIEAKVSTHYEIAPYVEFGTGRKGKESGGDKYPGPLSYRQDKWLANIPDVGYRWVEGQAAQPYLYPALKNNEELVKKNIASDLEKKIREVAGR